MAPQVAAKPRQTAKPANDQPPDERFWMKYSPNHELPLSSVASLAWHVLGLVLLVAVGYVVAWNAKKDMPIDTIEIGGGDGGGGGGGMNGLAGTDAPPAQPEAVVRNPNATPMPDIPKPPDTPDVQDPLNHPDVDVNPNEDRVLAEAAKKARDAAQKLGGLTNMKPSTGPPGPGTGPGNSGGPGPPGPGGNPTRARRQVRWTMSFTTESGEDYLRQLNYLGAVLFVETPGEPTRMYRHLDRRPAPAESEDPDVRKRLSWRDTNPTSIGPLAQAMGLDRTPSQIIAYFPQALEDQLVQKEKRHRGRPEDKIQYTVFQLLKLGNRYEIIVVDQR